MTEPAPGWYNGYIMRNREDNMKKLRFTVEYNYSNRDSEWFYDVVDHHPLRDKRVVGWYTAEPSWEGDRNYGYACAKGDARPSVRRLSALRVTRREPRETLTASKRRGGI